MSWFNPLILPARTDLRLNKVIRVLVCLARITINLRGPTFCSVIKIKVEGQFKPSMRAGNQK